MPSRFRVGSNLTKAQFNELNLSILSPSKGVTTAISAAGLPGLFKIKLVMLS